MGHALRKALGVIAVLQGWGQAAGTAVVAGLAGVPQLAASSLKAALNLDWDDSAARDHVLAEVLGLLDRVEGFIAGRAGRSPGRVACRPACRARGLWLPARRAGFEVFSRAGWRGTRQAPGNRDCR